VKDTVQAVEACTEAGVRVILTTPESAEHGLSIARATGIVTEENTDIDWNEHNEIIRNEVGQDAAIEYGDYKGENEYLDSMPEDLKERVTEKMAEMLTMPVHLVKEQGLDKFRDPNESPASIITATRVWNHVVNDYCDLKDMDTEWWEKLLRAKPQLVIARCEPIHRQLLTTNLQRIDHTVALTGIGPSDALALETADIGITTPDASSMVLAACDVTLDGGHFTGIVELIHEGRLVYENLKKTTAFLTCSNVPQMIGILSHVFLELPLTINAPLILLVDLLTNMIPSIAMAGEPPESNLMNQPPRKIKSERIVTFKMIFFSYFQIGMIQAFAGMYAYMCVMSDYGYTPMHLYEGGPKGNWGVSPMYCKFQGGRYVNTRGEVDITRDPTNDVPSHLYPLWDSGDGGIVEECVHPPSNFQGKGHFALHATPVNIGMASSYAHGHTTGRAMITVETLDALEHNKFFEYIPWKSRMSAFWRDEWLSYDITEQRESFSDNQIPTKTEDQISQHKDVRLTGSDVLRYFHYTSFGLWSLCLKDPTMEPMSKSHTLESTVYEEDAMGGWKWLFSAGRGRRDRSAYAGPTSWNASLLSTTGCQRNDADVEAGTMYHHALFCNGDNYRLSKQQYGPATDMYPELEWRSRSHLDDDGAPDVKTKTYESARGEWSVAGVFNIGNWKQNTFDFMKPKHHGDRDDDHTWAELTKPETDAYNVTRWNATSVARAQALCKTLDDHHHQLAYCRTECDYECERIPAEERFNKTGSLDFTLHHGHYSVYGDGRTCQCANIASRMCQQEALYNARTAFLVAIVACQIATVLAFKTRWLSIIEHGLANPLLNVGLFASLMAMALCTYSPLANSIFSTRPIRFYHWMPGLPWACIIIVYDEVRKWFMRKTSQTTIDENGDRTRVVGWLEANTHH